MAPTSLPAATARSKPLMEAARTFTRTSPSTGAGMGRSRMRAVASGDSMAYASIGVGPFQVLGDESDQLRTKRAVTTARASGAVILSGLQVISKAVRSTVASARRVTPSAEAAENCTTVVTVC